MKSKIKRWVNIDDDHWKDRIEQVTKKGYRFCLDNNGDMISRPATGKTKAYLMEKETKDQELMSDEALERTRKLRSETLSKTKPEPWDDDYPYILGLINRIKNKLIIFRTFSFDAFGYRIRLRIRRNRKPHFIFGIYKPKDWLNEVDAIGLIDEKARKE